MRTIDPVKHEQRRQQILAAASRCFVRDGFRGASITDICAEAQMSSGHLYHYFASKEAIFRTIVEAGLTHGTTQVEAMMASADPIKTFIDQASQSNPGKPGKADQSLLLEMLAEAKRNPAVADILQDHNREARSLLAAFLKTAQDKGQVDSNLDPDMAASMLLVVIDGAQAMSIRDPKMTRSQRFETVKLLIARLLLPKSTLT